MSKISVALIEILEKEHEAGSVGAQRIERISTLVQMFEVFSQWNDKSTMVVEHNIADTMIGGSNFS